MLKEEAGDELGSKKSEAKEKSGPCELSKVTRPLLLSKKT